MRHKISRRLTKGVAAACLLVVAGLAGIQARGASGSGGPDIGADNATVQACIARSEQFCNPDPSVKATFLAENPEAHPAGANPHYITEDQALALARGQNTTAPAVAKLMTRQEVRALDPVLAENAVPDPSRKQWVVTVSVKGFTPGGRGHSPQPVNGYTVVLDAETGITTDFCIGCTSLR